MALSPACAESSYEPGLSPVMRKRPSLVVVTQVALAFVLLVASGLMIRSFIALRAVTPLAIGIPTFCATLRFQYVLPSQPHSGPLPTVSVRAFFSHVPNLQLIALQ